MVKRSRKRERSLSFSVTVVGFLQRHQAFMLLECRNCKCQPPRAICRSFAAPVAMCFVAAFSPITLAFTRIFGCVSVTLREEEQQRVRSLQEWELEKSLWLSIQCESVAKLFPWWRKKGVAIHRENGQKQPVSDEKNPRSVRPAQRRRSSRGHQPHASCRFASRPRAEDATPTQQRTPRRPAAGAPSGRGLRLWGTRAARSRWHWHKRVAPPQAPTGKKIPCCWKGER